MIDGASIVSVESLLDGVLEHSGLIVVDARHNGDRNQSYIKVAKSLDDANADCTRLANILPSYDSPRCFAAMVWRAHEVPMPFSSQLPGLSR